MDTRRRPMRWTAILALLAAMSLAGTVPGSAQEATPTAGIEPTLRAAIHAGVCDDLGEVAYPLADLVYGLALIEDGTANATPGPTGAAVVGPPEANAAVSGTSVVPATIEELTRTPHAVNAFATADDPSPPRACGEIGGVRVGNDLVFGVGALSPTAYAGTAWLHENPDGTTTVALFLASGLFAEQGADPATTQAEGTSPATEEPTDGTTTPETDADTDLPAVPAAFQVASIEVAGGAFPPGEVTLLAGQPVVLSVFNSDDRAYRVEILDLVDAEVIVADATTEIGFTVPTPGMYEVRLLPAEGTEILDTLPLRVAAPEDVLE
jgi:hypothetical protein